MASGINNIHQPGTCNGSKAARSTSAEECNREMHMKMCKKIAQLTKVSLAVAVFPGRWGCPGRGCQGIVSSGAPVWQDGKETGPLFLGCCREHRCAQTSLHTAPPRGLQPIFRGRLCGRRWMPRRNCSNYRATIMRRAPAPRRRGVCLGAVGKDWQYPLFF